MKKILCPECDNQLKLGTRPHRGQRVNCVQCRMAWVVTALNPIELEERVLQQATTKKKMPHSVDLPCPNCDKDIKVNGQAHIGQILLCPACQTTLEVINNYPLDLDISSQISYRRNMMKQAQKRHNLEQGERYGISYS